MTWQGLPKIGTRRRSTPAGPRSGGENTWRYMRADILHQFPGSFASGGRQHHRQLFRTQPADLIGNSQPHFQYLRQASERLVCVWFESNQGELLSGPVSARAFPGQQTP